MAIEIAVCRPNNQLAKIWATVRNNNSYYYHEKHQKQYHTHTFIYVHVMVCGDFNARMGNSVVPNIVREFGELCLKKNGQELRQIAIASNLKITNTFFRKRDINKYTWSARGFRSIIEHALIYEKLKLHLQDVHWMILTHHFCFGTIYILGKVEE